MVIDGTIEDLIQIDPWGGNFFAKSFKSIEKRNQITNDSKKTEEEVKINHYRTLRIENDEHEPMTIEDLLNYIDPSHEFTQDR